MLTNILGLAGPIVLDYNSEHLDFLKQLSEIFCSSNLKSPSLAKPLPSYFRKY